MVALIMPLYQFSLAMMIKAFLELPLPAEIFMKVAHCVLGAGARFHDIKMCHCDIKPENVMILGQSFTVIDLRAVCKHNEEVKEYTNGYYLDAPTHELTPIFDLNCAAVTLARCCLPDFSVRRGMTRANLVEMS